MSTTDVRGPHTAARKADVPHQDAALKPDDPTDLHKPTWKYAAGRALREFSRDGCTDLAAALTYFSVLSIFPGLLALVSLLGLVGQAQTTTDFMVTTIQSLAPGNAADTVRQPIEALARGGGAGFAFFAGLLGALWSASGYVGAFGRALNKVFEVDEGRPMWKLRPTMLVITLSMVLLAVVGIGILVLSGPVATAVGDAIGLGETTLMVWNIAKWPALVLLAIVMVAVLYHFTPNVRQPKFRWLSIGATIALFVLALATAGFFFYVSNFGNYNATYGSIGGVIVLLLWIWIANNALLFGAEIDAELERARQLQAGIAAEETLQLPPRGTKQSIKQQDKLEADIASGERLRRVSAGQTFADQPAVPAGEKVAWAALLASGAAAFVATLRQRSGAS